MPPYRRVTLRDIAEAAGCHYTTVSLALRNHASIPMVTSKRLQALARRMGYVPDPMLASLSNYRSSLRTVGFHGTLGWITNHSTRDGWRQAEIFVDYFKSAVERAESLGYRMEEIWLREPGMTPARAVQILLARGITGLVVAPQPEPSTTIDLDWAPFSAVAVGYSLKHPRLHLVAPNQYRAMRLALNELASRGYARPGLAMLRASDDRVDNNWTAGFLSGQHRLGVRRPVPPLLLDGWQESEFIAWLQRYKPDVVITKCEQVLPVLRRLKLSAPRDIGLSFVTQVSPGGDRAGIYENPERVGAGAVELLIAMIHRNERGIPAVAQQLLVEASWVDGRGVRARADGRLCHFTLQ